ncbi:hypothetical protein CL689_05095 [Candidatus Saccharibacteria bacterium]|nr:hypothetical protein [Candidatus Saccharibacteria bacterium]|tara:strand:+ start:596 stop:853 length:258 start_codon:yes stop_codon:yes gene_type:complete
MKIKMSVLTKDDLLRLIDDAKKELAEREIRASQYREEDAESESTPPSGMYQHPIRTNLIWSGRGRAPMWMLELLESGYQKEELRV